MDIANLIYLTFISYDLAEIVNRRMCLPKLLIRKFLFHLNLVRIKSMTSNINESNISDNKVVNKFIIFFYNFCAKNLKKMIVS